MGMKYGYSSVPSSKKNYMSAMHDSFNYLFNTRLDAWTPIRNAVYKFFSQNEIEYLDRDGRTFNYEKSIIIILSFENRLVQVGGLGAVMRHLPEALKKEKENVLLFTPLHRGNSAVREAIDKGDLKVRLRGVELRICNYKTVIGCFEEKGVQVPTFHIDIEGRFLGCDNPYSYEDCEELLFDSLAFCAAVPRILQHLGYTSNVIINAHDWECAPIALFARLAVLSGILQKAKTMLTLNNSFDSPFPGEFKRLFFNRFLDGETVLQSMIPFSHGPIITVSTPYAYELRHDLLQQGFFVDHLQNIFSINPPIGIENGSLGKKSTPFSAKEMMDAEKGDYEPILKRKQAWRTRAMKILLDEKWNRSYGTFRKEFVNNLSIPLFFMSGRLDLMQKGYDAVFYAFRRLEKDRALLLFSPTPCKGNEDLSFFLEIADECKGNIIIWPFFIPAAHYRILLRGASFLIMPSFYEPFGSAGEGLINGTPVIARATGGLLSQLQPGKEYSIPPQYNKIIPEYCSTKKNAILFREIYPDDDEKKQWRTMLRFSLRQRIENPLYCAIVDSVYHALSEAINVFHNPDTYGSMIYNGVRSKGGFSWKETAEKYHKVFKAVSVRGL